MESETERKGSEARRTLMGSEEELGQVGLGSCGQRIVTGGLEEVSWRDRH